MSPVEVVPKPLAGLESVRAPADGASSPVWIHVVLFFATLATTTLIGMRYMANFGAGRLPLASADDIFPFAWIARHIGSFALGLPFSVTLLSILLAHEFAHFFACRHYGVRASLPYLLPAPTLSGTAGAVIRLRSRVRTRGALLVIGASGPIAGFVIAIAAAWMGLMLSKPSIGPLAVPVTQFNVPAVMWLLHALLLHLVPSTPPLRLTVPHPVLVASWIGILITSLNLIPAGQLDGGHILYAISPRAHRISSRVVIVLLVVLGAVQWVGWLLWAGILLLPRMRHPRVDGGTPPRPWQVALAGIALLIFLSTGILQPFTHASLLELCGPTGWRLGF